MVVVPFLTSPVIFVLVLYLSFISFPISGTETNALLELKAKMENTTALDSSWINGTTPCDKLKPWEGIICENGSVGGLRLENLGLSGDFNAKPLACLQDLRTISLAHNTFCGKIPDLSILGSLKALYLQGNQFYGEIPPAFFSLMRSLKKVNLSSNKFSGKIPGSLAEIPNLMELHLQYNEFSGHVAILPQPSLTDINLSNNKLEGPIPQAMLKFKPIVFENNPGLCSRMIGKECSTGHPGKVNSSTDLPDAGEVDESHGSRTKWLMLGSVVGLLLFMLMFKGRNKDPHTVLANESIRSSMYTKTPSSNNSSSRRSYFGVIRSLRKGSLKSSSENELVVVNGDRGIFELKDLMKAAAQILGNGALGSSYKAVLADDCTVVVKKLREMNEMSRDAFDIEIRKLGRLRHPNILPPLAYHYKYEEHLLVTEYVPRGSLMDLLHGERGEFYTELDWPTRLKIIQGVARGMGFLHSEFAAYVLPHGNLKSSNILVALDYEPLLTDYAFHPLISHTHATQALFAFTSPEAILFKHPCPKSDVYCLGIIILEVLTGRFPSQYLNNQNGGIDVVKWTRNAIAEGKELAMLDPALLTLDPNSIPQIEMLLHIGSACTEYDHHHRIDMKEAVWRILEIQVY